MTNWRIRYMTCSNSSWGLWHCYMTCLSCNNATTCLSCTICNNDYPAAWFDIVVKSRSRVVSVLQSCVELTQPHDGTLSVWNGPNVSTKDETECADNLGCMMMMQSSLSGYVVQVYKGRFSIYTRVSIASLPALYCDWKCIWNNLDVCLVTMLE